MHIFFVYIYIRSFAIGSYENGSGACKWLANSHINNAVVARRWNCDKSNINTIGYRPGNGKIAQKSPEEAVSELLKSNQD